MIVALIDRSMEVLETKTFKVFESDNSTVSIITVENVMQFSTVIGQFVTAYVLLSYGFVCAIGFIIHHFFHRFHRHLQNIFCIHLTRESHEFSMSASRVASSIAS